MPQTNKSATVAKSKIFLKLNKASWQGFDLGRACLKNGRKPSIAAGSSCQPRSILVNGSIYMLTPEPALALPNKCVALPGRARAAGTAGVSAQPAAMPWATDRMTGSLRHASSEMSPPHRDFEAIQPCLVPEKNCKIFQISRHIESLDVCMEY